MTDISKINIERINELSTKLDNFNTQINNINSKINSMKYVIDVILMVIVGTENGMMDLLNKAEIIL